MAHMVELLAVVDFEFVVVAVGCSIWCRVAGSSSEAPYRRAGHVAYGGLVALACWNTIPYAAWTGHRAQKTRPKAPTSHTRHHGPLAVS